jgi:GTP-binding protein Era
MIHCGFVGLLGLPNAGKSTFLNRVLGEKISIVSSKPQTTRQAFSGLVTNQDYQLIFLDAPGFVEPKAGLFEFLSREFSRVIEKSEHLLVLISIDQSETPTLKKFLAKIEGAGRPWSVLLTKNDLDESVWVSQQRAQWTEQGKIVASYSVHDPKSNADGKSLLTQVAATLPQEKASLFDPEMISLDRTRDIVSEFVREACFNNVEQEIPFGLGVIIKSFKRQKGLLRIEANILVEKESHKGIVIGKGGKKLKTIGEQARRQIQELLGEKVFLGLFVTYKKNWMRNQSIMQEVGYVPDKA